MRSIARCITLHRAARCGNPSGFPLWLPFLLGLALLAGCGDFVLFPEDEVRPVADFTMSPTETEACGVDDVDVDASGSSDPESDELAYKWSFQSAPSGSTASFQDDDAVTTDFSPDKAGTYEVMLTVTATTREVSSEKVQSMSAKENPIAEISYEPASVKEGNTVTLDGTASMDPLDGCEDTNLTFTWNVKDPSEGAVTLDETDPAKPTFTADQVGDYTVNLTVKSSHGSALTGSVSVTIAVAASESF